MNDVEVARAAAAAGAAIVRERFGRTTARIDKGHAFEFATEADLDAEHAITEVLRRERPEDGVVGEEHGRSGGTGTRLWLVDPLCGTTNFAAGVPLVAVNVALAVSGRPTVAAVIDPFHDETFWTDGFAAAVRHDGHDAPLVPDGRSGSVDFNLEPPYPSAPRFAALAMMGDTGFAAAFQARVTSTSLALTWVAMGRRAAYVTDGDLRDHVHFAAGLAICRAAGCVVTDLQGEPLPPDGHGHGLLAAADQATHAALLAVVERLAGDRLAT
ncbi:MAG TPA: inositol monophosphatase family protein [Candidatus Limnocylindria bacterium]